MANYNKVILIGNLTRDPQLSYTANNMAVADFGIAVNNKRRGPDGQIRDEPMFIDCRVFDKRAETFSQYMSKGRPVLIEGRLQLQQWQAQDGSKRSKHAIVVDNFQFLGQGGGGEGGPRRAAPEQQAAPAAGRTAQQQPADAGPDYTAPEPPGPPDDVPF